MSWRIAHVTASFPPYQAGTGNVAYHNVTELARRGHDVHVFTAAVPGAPHEETLEGVRVHRLRPWIRYGNAALLPQLFGRLRPFDLIHLHLPFFGGAEAVRARVVLGAPPLVTTYHHDVILPGLPGRLISLHDRFIGRKLMEAARFACFTSLDYAEHSRLTRARAGARPLNIVELPNGIDVARFTPGSGTAELQRALGVNGRRVVLFVGALDRAHYFKGVDRLLEAFGRLDREDALLVVAGEGELRPGYRQIAGKLGLGERVVFPGHVPPAALPDYYRLADVTVLPSVTAGEAFGLVLLESLACATPVIAGRLPGVRTVVDEGADGFLVTPGDAADLAARLAYVLALSDAERRAMGAAGRRKVEARYSWERIGDILEGLYAQVAGEDSRAVGAEAGR